MARLPCTQLGAILALAATACSSSAGVTRDGGADVAVYLNPDTSSSPGDDRPPEIACEVALNDSLAPCPAMFSQAQVGDAGQLTTPCGTLEHLIPPPSDVFFGSWDCFYDMTSGALVGWDTFTDAPSYCGNTAAGVYAGNVPAACATFLYTPAWRRVPLDGGAG